MLHTRQICSHDDKFFNNFYLVVSLLQFVSPSFHQSDAAISIFKKRGTDIAFASLTAW